MGNIDGAAHLSLLLLCSESKQNLDSNVLGCDNLTKTPNYFCFKYMQSIVHEINHHIFALFFLIFKEMEHHDSIWRMITIC